MFSDYYSHIVGESCKEVEGGHQLDTFVWVREKQPAMFVRNKVRNYLVSKEHDIESMVKSNLVGCWGKDIY